MITIIGHVILSSSIGTCGHCGRDGLRSMVRAMVDGAELTIGTGCAARLLGVPAATIKATATRADRNRELAHKEAMAAWRAARHSVVIRAFGLGGPGWPEAVDAALSRWEAENPQPVAD